MSTTHRLVCLLAALAPSLAPDPVAASPATMSPRGARPGIEANAVLPVRFERIEAGPGGVAAFAARANAGRVEVCAGAVTFVIHEGRHPSAPAAASRRSSRVAMTLRGARAEATLAGEERQPWRSSYLMGSDPTKWRRGVEGYARVRASAVYAGVDAVYRGTGEALEFDFELAPGADPSVIRLAFEGARAVALEPNGALRVDADAGSVRLRPPRVFQPGTPAPSEVAGRFARRGPAEFGFEVGPWDRRRPLVIDPVVTMATFLGGSQTEITDALALDREGNAYVVGRTWSDDFPGSGSKPGAGWGEDVFVAKLAADGSRLLWSAYLGGDGQDWPHAAAVDPDGNLYLVGYTMSPDFPTLNAFQAEMEGNSEHFVLKLDAATGELRYSTFLHVDPWNEDHYRIAVDVAGQAVVAGTAVGGLATHRAVQGEPRGAWDLIVAKLSADGRELVFATYLGGSAQEHRPGVAIDANGAVIVTGSTFSDDYPVEHALQSERAGGDYDVVVTKLSPDGQEIAFSTYLGGALGADLPGAVATTADGRIVLAGNTASADFPLRHPLQDALVGYSDGFVTVLAGDGQEVTFSTLFGGDSGPSPRYVALDGAGRIYVSGGGTLSGADVRDPAFCSGGRFVAALDVGARSWLYATPIPLDSDVPIAVTPTGDVVLAGTSSDRTFLATPGAYDTQCGTGDSCGDAVLLRLAPQARPLVAAALSPPESTVTEWDTTSELVLSIDTPQPGDTVASLSANHYWPWVEMPSTVTIPAGATSATFPVRRRYFHEVVVKARLPWLLGGCEAAATIRYSGPVDFYMDVRKSRLLPGESTVLELKRNYSENTEMLVQLASSRPDALRVPATAVIPAWSRRRDVEIEALAPADDIVITGVATWAGKTNGYLAVVSVVVPVQAMTATIPVVAHQPGAAGTVWRTEVTAVNPASWPATVTMTLRAGGTSATREAVLPAGSAVEWGDVVESLFGLEPAARVSGWIEVASNLPVALGTRTYNLGTAGTYGQQFPILPPESGVRPGDAGFLPLLRSDSEFRTNVGFLASGEPGPCAVRLRLFARDGLQLGRTETFDLESTRWMQVNDIFTALGAGQTGTAYARVDAITGGQCRVWAYGSVVDNRTGDPTTVALEPANRNTLVLPGVVHTPGALGSQWRSEVAIVNASHLLARIKAELFGQAGAAAPVRRSLVLFPGSSISWRDVVTSLFGLESSGSTSGLVRLTSNTSTIAGCRTYNEGGTGTFGQSFPVIGPYEPPLLEGKRGYLVPVRKSVRFRTNVGFVNPGAQVSARLRLYDGGGAQLGQEVSIDLPAESFSQINDVFSRAGAEARELAYAVVEVGPTAAGVWAYASVIDNRTGDPTTVSVQVPPEVVAPSPLD